MGIIDYIKLVFWLMPFAITLLVGICIGISITTVFFNKVVNKKDDFIS